MNRKSVFLTILKILGILFTVYGLLVLFTLGPTSLFNFFYLTGGILFLLIVRYNSWIKDHLSKKVLKVFNILVLVFLISFVSVEAKIISFGLSTPEKDADYVIVLGCLTRKSGPSKDFRARLDKAYEYLMENPDTMLITTGGKGNNEPTSEAKSGKEYLMKLGVSESQILMEDQSMNTFENLQNVKNILKEQDISKLNIVIVSADYHLYRAGLLAKKLGYENVSFDASHGLFFLVPQQYTREYFGLIKAYLFDHE